MLDLLSALIFSLKVRYDEESVFYMLREFHFSVIVLWNLTKYNFVRLLRQKGEKSLCLVIRNKSKLCCLQPQLYLRSIFQTLFFVFIVFYMNWRIYNFGAIAPEVKMFSNMSIVQNHVLSQVSYWVGRSKNMICSCESSWNEDSKIGIEFVSSSNTFSRK